MLFPTFVRGAPVDLLETAGYALGVIFSEMLLNTGDQVINIALSLGENDTKSIARRFKQIYGCTPHEWREQHQKDRQ